MTGLQHKIFLGIVLVLCSLSATAQVGEQRNNLSVGFNAGVNMNSVSFTPNIKQGTLMGMTGGLTARYISEKYFAMICGIQMELNYSQHGWKESYDEGVEDSYSRTMDYIEMPLLAHLAFGKEEKGLQFFLNFGPQIGFLLKETEKISDIWDPSGRTKEQYGKMADNKFDYGIAVGGGFELKTRKVGNFLLEARYYLALSDFYNNTKKDYFSRSAHTALQAKVTYLFDLKR